MGGFQNVAARKRPLLKKRHRCTPPRGTIWLSWRVCTRSGGRYKYAEAKLLWKTTTYLGYETGKEEIDKVPLERSQIVYEIPMFQYRRFLRGENHRT
uniref:Uncharacterized protein n=1 Tax=Megaselia scalaris TaxID=36166 RepID=T1GUT7_MEGSC